MIKNSLTLIFAGLLSVSLSGCLNLTRGEQDRLYYLKTQNITIDRPYPDWEKPASPWATAFYSFLPGGGNFYLAGGNAGESQLYPWAIVDLLTWPFSIIWGVPQGVIDANTVNRRDLVYFSFYHQPQDKEKTE